MKPKYQLFFYCLLILYSICFFLNYLCYNLYTHSMAKALLFWYGFFLSLDPFD